MSELEFEGVLDEDYLRELPWKDRWFTSFGYISDEENQKVLRQFHDVLKPGGRLVLETQNVTRIMLNPRLIHVIGERDGDEMIDRWEVDPESARFRTERLVVGDSRARKAHFGVR
jgi:SAM-dependent methyltransferase